MRRTSAAASVNVMSVLWGAHGRYAAVDFTRSRSLLREGDALRDHGPHATMVLCTPLRRAVPNTALRSGKAERTDASRRAIAPFPWGLRGPMLPAPSNGDS